MIYNIIMTQITECLNSLSKLNESCQIYIDTHDQYLESTLKDSDLLKEKMKEKVVRVINE